MKPISRNHPLVTLFSDALESGLERTHTSATPPAHDYLLDLFVRFVHTESIFAIKRDGRPVDSVIEMVAEGDVRLHAQSFERERQVHRHIGDYILFWSGVYPNYLNRLKTDSGIDLLCDYTERGKESYLVVSTFDHDPFREEAPVFRELSENFERFSSAISLAAQRLPFSA